MTSSLTFAQLFQNKVSFMGMTPQVVTIAELEEAAHRVSTHQVPLIATRVATIKSNIVKTKQLWQVLVLARITESGEDYLVHGRHRTAAIAEICNNYGVTASGKIVELGRFDKDGQPIPNPDHTKIEPAVSVLRVVVPDMETLSALQETFNGSRSMSPAEKILMEAAAKGALSPAKEAKMKLVTEFMTKGLFSTLQIALGVATAVQSALANPDKYLDKVLGEVENPYAFSTKTKLEWDVDGDAIGAICLEFAEYMELYKDEVPSNMGLNYKGLVNKVLTQGVSLTDENGDEYIGSLLESIAALLPAPEKATKTRGASAQVKELQEQLAELRAQLMAKA
jgi:uncharacterized protein with GYD domain